MKDLGKQAQDVDLLINRMDDQVKELMKTLRDELNQVEVNVATINVSSF